MEYNLKKVLKNLFINLIITFVIVFIINYFGINSDKHGWFANIIDKINFIHIFGNKTANTVVIVGLAITILNLYTMCSLMMKMKTKKIVRRTRC